MSACGTRSTRSRTFGAGLGALCVCMALAASASAGVPTAGFERSSGDDLALKRYVAAGDRAYVIGSEDGGFPPMGWHTRGEMGGVWAHPIKLLDGYWFSLNGSWLPAAKRFASGPGYTRMSFPETNGFDVSATQFSPDGSPVVLHGLRIRNSSGRSLPLSLLMDSRSEVMSSYPWGSTTPSAKELNGLDVGSFDAGSGRVTFREPDEPWFASVGANVAPSKGEIGDSFWGPVPAPEWPEYLENGNGTGARLTWNLKVPAHGSRTLWVAIAGSDRSRGEANATLRDALADPARALERKIAQRERILDRTRVSLPDATLDAAFDWGKLNMADLRRTVEDADLRDVDEGRAYPSPVATLPRLTGIGAGYPDYPWYFGTDGAYTAYPLVASGQWGTAKQHLRGIRDVSRAINGGTGKVVHEVVTDGSVYFGANDDAGNTNETVEFATAVGLLWRWTGDDAFRDEMYGFVVDGLRHVTSALDEDGDGWPEGNGMVERTGMGSEKLDVTAYTWMALGSLAEMAASKGDAATESWAREQAGAIEQRFDARWWSDSEGLFADSLCNPGDEGDPGTNVCTAPDQALQQRHWINATPMEAGLAPPAHARAALDRLESSTFTGDCGLFHTGVGGGPDGAGELKCWTLGSSVMAVAEANRGRLAADQAPFYMDAVAGTLDLEMPGALPEIIPRADEDPFVDFRDRAMFMQAWSSYGTQWPVIASFLGVDPDVPAGEVSVVPDVPEGWPELSVRDLRVGSGNVSAEASRGGNRYVTKAEAPRGLDLTIGHVLPEDASPASVRLDGHEVEFRVVETARGQEVHVDAGARGSHKLVVTSD
jgi:glycogen debranching enzyme